MNKCISYSIFRGDCEEFEFKAYLKGLYFNLRMNKLIYPDWDNIIHIPEHLAKEYQLFLSGLYDRFQVAFDYPKEGPLCEKMLWRMLPIWGGGYKLNYDYVLCRDSDALTTYREAQMVHQWVTWVTRNHYAIHAILDNPAHSGLMGGMVGFHCESIRKNFLSFEALIKGSDLKKRGSDQDLLNNKIYPVFKNFIHWDDHKTDFNKTDAFRPKGSSIPGVSDKLWESNLCAAFIGAPGFNELETLRFFKRFDKTDYSDFEKRHKDLFWWV